MGRLAKEVGVVGGKGIDQGNEALPAAIPQHVLVVLAKRAQVQRAHLLRETRRHQLLFAGAEFQAELLTRELRDRGELRRRQRDGFEHLLNP